MTTRDRPYMRMAELSVAELAYIAALIDTRANLTSRTVGDAVLPQVDINGGPLDVLSWLGELTGIQVTETRRSYLRSGCTDHCPEKHVHIVSTSGRWSVSGAKATVVLAAVLPYLRLRRPEVHEAVNLGLASRFKGATVEKMRAAGWPIPEEMAPAPKSGTVSDAEGSGTPTLL